MGTVIRKLKVIIPRSEKDMEELRRLDKVGKLASGNSYPTAEQLAELPPARKKHGKTNRLSISGQPKEIRQ